MRGIGRESVLLAASVQENPSPTRTMMSINEMPVAAGMQWKAKSSRMELAEYAQRKKSVQDLREGGAAAGWG